MSTMSESRESMMELQRTEDCWDPLTEGTSWTPSKAEEGNVVYGCSFT